jgi:hypothetical protein
MVSTCHEKLSSKATRIDMEDVSLTIHHFQTVNIRNLTGDFADGLAFCAIIHHYFPDEFDFNQLKCDEKQKNFDLAFRIAE